MVKMVLCAFDQSMIGAVGEELVIVVNRQLMIYIDCSSDNHHHYYNVLHADKRSHGDDGMIMMNVNDCYDIHIVSN